MTNRNYLKNSLRNNTCKNCKVLNNIVYAARNRAEEIIKENDCKMILKTKNNHGVIILLPKNQTCENFVKTEEYNVKVIENLIHTSKS